MGSYEQLGVEYYDSARHPTSANFREASKLLIRDWVLELSAGDGLVVETGAGDSVVAEILSEAGVPLEGIVVTDASPAMLAHSSKWQTHGATLRRADAANLPFPSRKVEGLVACLGDPYNTPTFWREVKRVLRSNGQCIYTAPSIEWAKAWAKGQPNEAWSLFDVGNGETLQMPSLILSRDAQRRLIEDNGLHVIDVRDARIASLTGPISPRLLPAEDQPVVTAWRVEQVIDDRMEA